MTYNKCIVINEEDNHKCIPLEFLFCLGGYAYRDVPNVPMFRRWLVNVADIPHTVIISVQPCCPIRGFTYLLKIKHIQSKPYLLFSSQITSNSHIIIFHKCNTMTNLIILQFN